MNIYLCYHTEEIKDGFDVISAPDETRLFELYAVFNNKKEPYLVINLSENSQMENLIYAR